MSSLNYEQKHLEDLERIENFRLIDDDFMTVVFRNKKCAELLIQIIMGNDQLRVLSVNTQYGMKNLHGRSAKLDVFVIDETGKMHDVEIQRSDKGAHAKRARYNSSLMDADITEPGDEYQNLPESYTIFITENDVIKGGLPIYHMDRVIKETGESFGDGSHIIYVNASITDESQLGRLMHDFWCTKPDDMYYKELAKECNYHKNTEEGVQAMCREMEKMRAMERAEGHAEGRAEGLAEGLGNATQMIKEYNTSYSLEKAALAGNVTVEAARKLLEEAGVLKSS